MGGSPSRLDLTAALSRQTCSRTRSRSGASIDQTRVLNLGPIMRKGKGVTSPLRSGRYGGKTKPGAWGLTGSLESWRKWVPWGQHGL